LDRSVILTHNPTLPVAIDLFTLQFSGPTDSIGKTVPSKRTPEGRAPEMGRVAIAQDSAIGRCSKRPKGEAHGWAESQFRRKAELDAQSAPEGRGPGMGRVTIAQDSAIGRSKGTPKGRSPWMG